MMCPIFCQYGELNVSELARVCDMSRTIVYNQAKQVCKRTFRLALRRLSSMGNNPMVGMTVAVAVAIEEAGK